MGWNIQQDWRFGFQHGDKVKIKNKNKNHGRGNLDLQKCRSRSAKHLIKHLKHMVTARAYSLLFLRPTTNPRASCTSTSFTSFLTKDEQTLSGGLVQKSFGWVVDECLDQRKGNFCRASQAQSSGNVASTLPSTCIAVQNGQWWREKKGKGERLEEKTVISVSFWILKLFMYV